MFFDTIGSIIYKEKKYSTSVIRKNVNNVKAFVKRNINNNNIVAVAVNRDEKLLYIILGLIECNITFLPIDLSLPKERIAYMLKDAGVNYVIMSELDSDIIFSEYKCILEEDVLKNREDNNISASCIYDNPVYILYTSGSTGKPKAVAISYEGFSNFLQAIPLKIEFNRRGIIACFTTFSFDIFFLEAVLGLVNGLTVVLAGSDERTNARSLIKLIKKHNITMLQMTPSQMKMLIMCTNNDLSFLETVEILMLGGERLTDELFCLLREGTKSKIYNMYGPTETTIWSTVSELSQKEKVDIGKPIKNTSIYIVDEHRNIVEDGQEGEILIGGKGVALGYVNRVKLTEQKFIKLPFEPFEKVYCTGDIGKINEHGDLEYIGRKDNQVKIRGHRIELEEIEYYIKKVDEIKSAVVCEKHGQLICFYISDSEVENSEINGYISHNLPTYMIPNFYFKVDCFEYTISGKIDRNAMLFKQNIELEEQCNNCIEKIDKDNIDLNVMRIIKRNLDTELVDIEINSHSKIKDIGIDSLSFMQIIVELEENFDFEFEDHYLDYECFVTVEDVINYVKKMQL